MVLNTMSFLSKLRPFKKVDVPQSANSAPNPTSPSMPNESVANVQTLFQDALVSHQNGQLSHAQSIYEKILAIQPDHADALHCLGVIAMQLNAPAQAAEIIGRAIAISPTNFGFYMNYGNALRQSGQLESAIASFDHAIALKPDFSDAYTLRGNALQALQRLDAAIGSYNRALAIQPSDILACYNRGNALKALGQMEAAIASFDQAIAIKPDFAEAFVNKGLAQQELQQAAAALASYDAAISINPEFAEAYFNRGLLLRSMNQLEMAVSSFDKAISIQPGFASAHFNRGVTQQELNQPSAAVCSYDAAIAFQPDYAEAFANRGVAQHALKQTNVAIESYDKAIAINPNYVQAFINRGLALHEQQQLKAALASYDQAILLEPRSADACCSRGRALNDLKQHEDAVASYDRAIALKPGYADAYYNRGIAMGLMRKVDLAEDSYQRALEIDPSLTEAHHNLALSRLTRGDIQTATLGFRNALAIDPLRDAAHSGLLLCLSSETNVDATTLFAEHVRFGTQFETPLRPLWKPHTNVIDQGRVLNIGFVSGDLNNHAVATFIEPVLQELSKTSALSLHAYYNHTVHDHVNQRLQDYFDHWNEVATLSHAELAEKIRADSIDILIDLSGHTGLNRLVTFAHKPAPIQASWIGFPGTTGLKSMDYYLTDRFFLPPSEFSHQFTEKLVCMPASALFLPSKDAPNVNALPALTNGYVTFGSFNKLKKFSPAVVALWAQVLHAQPQSRMLLGGMESAESPMVVEWFANEGISGERLRFHPVSDMQTYLSLHHQVDICLDTFPYNGGTTTLHALWMGVPTLTLSGSTPVSRCGACITGHMGFHSFQANSSNEFVEHSLRWADRLEELSQIRSHMRERFSATPMGRPPVLAAGLEKAFRIMWQRWCQQLPPESFSVD